MTIAANASAAIGPAAAGIGFETASGERVERLIDVIGRLADLMRQEVAALHERAPQRISGLLAEKERLAGAYADEMNLLRGEPGPIRTVEPGLIDRLKAAGESFRAVVEENARALYVAKTVNEKFVRAVSEAVKERARPAINYSSTGSYAGPARASSGEAVAVAVDQSI